MKIVVYICIGYSYNGQSVLLKKSSSLIIILLSLFCIVLATIKLNYKLCLGTIKISYVLPQHLLSRKTYGITAQKNRTKGVFLP